MTDGIWPMLVLATTKSWRVTLGLLDIPWPTSFYFLQRRKRKQTNKTFGICVCKFHYWFEMSLFLKDVSIIKKIKTINNDYPKHTKNSFFLNVCCVLCSECFCVVPCVWFCTFLLKVYGYVWPKMLIISSLLKMMVCHYWLLTSAQ